MPRCLVSANRQSPYVCMHPLTFVALSSHGAFCCSSRFLDVQEREKFLREFVHICSGLASIVEFLRGWLYSACEGVFFRSARVDYVV